MFRFLKRILNPASTPPLGEPTSSSLAEYLFLDRPRLKSYVEQISGPHQMVKLPTWDVGLSAKGPSVTAKQSTTSREFTDHEMVETVLSYLRDNDLLAWSRPLEHHDVEKQFVLEKVEGQKAILDVDGDIAPGGLQEISVWVSPPAKRHLNGSGYSEGTFLYLLEAYWEDDHPCSTTWSNFSAFNAIVSELERASVLIDAPKPFVHGGKMAGFRVDEEHGSLAWLSPIDSLQRLGARIQPTRTIETLYRKRYLTDEQVFEDENGTHRCNDLFAYPIFIRE